MTLHDSQQHVDVERTNAFAPVWCLNNIRSSAVWGTRNPYECPVTQTIQLPGQYACAFRSPVKGALQAGAVQKWILCRQCYTSLHTYRLLVLDVANGIQPSVMLRPSGAPQRQRHLHKMECQHPQENLKGSLHRMLGSLIMHASPLLILAAYDSHSAHVECRPRRCHYKRLNQMTSYWIERSMYDRQSALSIVQHGTYHSCN